MDFEQIFVKYISYNICELVRFPEIRVPIYYLKLIIKPGVVESLSSVTSM